MSSQTRHILIEAGVTEISVETNKDIPGRVFIHINSGGFRFCQSVSTNEARFIGLAFFDAMEAAYETVEAVGG